MSFRTAPLIKQAQSQSKIYPPKKYRIIRRGKGVGMSWNMDLVKTRIIVSVAQESRGLDGDDEYHCHDFFDL